jgi:hypothetical protein
MPTSFSGGCACGAIRYECSADPAMSFHCHCRDCQRASGSAYYPAVVVPTTAVTLTAGSPKYNSMKADSGTTKHYGFCPDCGSPVLATIDEHPDIRVIAAGSLDNPSWFKPTMDFFTSSAQPWDYMNPALQQFETEPAE